MCHGDNTDFTFKNACSTGCYTEGYLYQHCATSFIVFLGLVPRVHRFLVIIKTTDSCQVWFFEHAHSAPIRLSANYWFDHSWLDVWIAGFHIGLGKSLSSRCWTKDLGTRLSFHYRRLKKNLVTAQNNLQVRLITLQHSGSQIGKQSNMDSSSCREWMYCPADRFQHKSTFNSGLHPLLGFVLPHLYSKGVAPGGVKYHFSFDQPSPR